MSVLVIGSVVIVVVLGVCLRLIGDPRTAASDRALLKRIEEAHRDLGIGA